MYRQSQMADVGVARLLASALCLIVFKCKCAARSLFFSRPRSSLLCILSSSFSLRPSATQRDSPWGIQISSTMWRDGRRSRTAAFPSTRSGNINQFVPLEMQRTSKLSIGMKGNQDCSIRHKMLH
ncbi:uncharacterized protein J3D65DRAFT_101393 [Phyllosticta citribraziliensis]|uniref:Secreted protein n=1 Tax=Phyllosticta citribraziliensis TaxID=989973 RepID=A0ABR1LCG4_9PEZI